MTWAHLIALTMAKWKPFKQFSFSQCDRLARDALLHYLKGFKK
jgi:hypothetical protein